MNDDWKKRIDDWEDREKQRKQHERDEAENRKRNEELARAEVAREVAMREYQNKIRNLGQKFRCHICNKPAEKEGMKEIGYEDHFPTGENSMEMPWRSYEYGSDWSIPGDLYQCKICYKWTCENCMHKLICKECAEKL